LVAQISTNAKIGWSANDTGVVGSTDLGMIPYLSIYETIEGSYIDSSPVAIPFFLIFLP